jgi:hypothetical protein
MYPRYINKDCRLRMELKGKNQRKYLSKLKCGICWGKLNVQFMDGTQEWNLRVKYKDGT